MSDDLRDAFKSLEDSGKLEKLERKLNKQRQKYNSSPMRDEAARANAALAKWTEVKSIRQALLHFGRTLLKDSSKSNQPQTYLDSKKASPEDPINDFVCIGFARWFFPELGEEDEEVSDGYAIKQIQAIQRVLTDSWEDQVSLLEGCDTPINDLNPSNLLKKGLHKTCYQIRLSAQKYI